MKTFFNLLTLFITWIVCVAAVGFTAGITYGFGKPFFKMGAALFGA